MTVRTSYIGCTRIFHKILEFLINLTTSGWQYLLKNTNRHIYSLRAFIWYQNQYSMTNHSWDMACTTSNLKNRYFLAFCQFWPWPIGQIWQKVPKDTSRGIILIWGHFGLFWPIWPLPVGPTGPKVPKVTSTGQDL